MAETSIGLGPDRKASVPPVRKPAMIALAGSSLPPRTPLTAQSNEENMPPQTPN